MSISGALNNALTGLQAAGRATQIVSSNLANSLTPGYGKRTLELSSKSLGGVNVEGVLRNVTPALIADRQLASAAYSKEQVTSDFLSHLEGLLGTPDEVGSLSQTISEFESSLITAISRPDANERLDAAVEAARSLADKLNTVSSGIQKQRTQADNTIDFQVTKVNESLQELEKINAQIVKSSQKGSNTATLLDYRQTLVDDISEIIPVKTISRPNGAIALFTTGGAILLDDKAAVIGFEKANIVSSGMSIEAGSLSGLTINGMEIKTGSENSPLRGGSLIAQFEVRDSLAPDAQTQLDAVSRDLIERFEEIAPTTGSGTPLPGLFTDNGNLFDSTSEIGLSGRININTVVDPREGGQSWKLRDGLDATVPGDVGNSTNLELLVNALTATRQPATGHFGTGSFSTEDLTSTMLSSIASDRILSDQKLGFASAQFTEMTQQELADGVDSDAELQRMILIEQAYAANARMIQTVDEMIQTLLRL